MSQYYAVTSLSGEEGTWFIVADSDTYQGAIDLGSQIIGGPVVGGDTEDSLPVAQMPVAAQMRHLRVYRLPRAVHLCGSGALQRYQALTQGVTPGINSSGGGPGVVALFNRPLAGSMPSGGLSRYLASTGVYSAPATAAVDGSGVYQWNDQVGATNTGQSTAGAQPTFKVGQISSSAQGCQAGFDAGIVFDGTDDVLVSSALALGTAYTLIATVKFGLGVVSGGAADYLLLIGSNVLTADVGGVAVNSNAHGMTAGNWYTIGVRVSAGVVDWAVNSVNPGTLGAGTTGTSSYTPTQIGAVGSGNWFAGELAEAAFYARQLSQADFAQAMRVHQLLYGAW